MGSEYADFASAMEIPRVLGKQLLQGKHSVLEGLLTMSDYNLSDDNTLETGGFQFVKPWLGQVVPPANHPEVWATFWSNPTGYFCNTLLSLSTFYVLLFLLDCILALSLSISFPHLPHIDRESLLTKVDDFPLVPFVSITTWILGPIEATIFFVYYFGYKTLPDHQPGESHTLRIVTTLFMIPLWTIMVMGGFLAFGISAWGLLAGRWLKRLNPIRRVNEWIELRNVDELERGWEGRSRSFLGMGGSLEEPARLAYSGVMVVCAQEPVPPPKQAPLRPLPPPKPVAAGPSKEEIQSLRDGCKRMSELRERMRGRMVEMKAEIDRLGGDHEKGIQMVPMAQPLPHPQAQPHQRYRSSTRHGPAIAHRIKVKV